MSDFDELFNMLYDKLMNERCIADINQFSFEHASEIVRVTFDYSDKMFYVASVKTIDDIPDYGYPYRTMELYEWLMRENMEIATVELEKTIFRLI